MKIKLLKKIRKQYTIIHYPTQFRHYDSTYYGNCMVLYDNENSHNMNGIEIGVKNQNWFNRNKIVVNEQEAKQYLINIILKRVRNNYFNYSIKNKRETNKQKKIWYNA